MKFSASALSLAIISLGSANAFTTQSKSVAFVGHKTAAVAKTAGHASGCVCPSCAQWHTSNCGCGRCQGTALFADVAEEVAATEGEVPAEVPATEGEVPGEVAATEGEVPAEVPEEVVAMDGVESEEEAHNVDRPARKELKKKRAPKGKDISELEIGAMVTGSVKSITNYGAFVDIGATTDGLLHISQLSNGYVASVGEILKEGQEVEVRIISVDASKSQVALSMMTEEESNSQPQRKPRQSNRRDDSATLSSLNDKGWDSSAFVEGTVVSTVDFGCFVRIDTSLLNSECKGELDGLVHISALANGRVNSVTDVVNVDQTVKVRVKSITGNKVSLTMISVEDEESKRDSFGPAPGAFEGAKDWKESLEKFDATMPVFTNGVVGLDRKD